MSPRDAVLQQALALATEDRAYLAEELERSLPASPFASEEIAAAWSQEIDRRITAYRSGQTQTIGFDEALDHIRQALAEPRLARQGQQ